MVKLPTRRFLSCDRKGYSLFLSVLPPYTDLFRLLFPFVRTVRGVVGPSDPESFTLSDPKFDFGAQEYIGSAPTSNQPDPMPVFEWFVFKSPFYKVVFINWVTFIKYEQVYKCLLDD